MKYSRGPKTRQCMSGPSALSDSLRPFSNVFFKRGEINKLGQSKAAAET